MALRILLPVGFLGAAGIVVLLVLYLLKPKYKEKQVTATPVWRRVIARRRPPVLCHILIFLLQAAVLALMAFALAEPRLFAEDALSGGEEVLIILDASASMRAREAGGEGPTRFERAVAAAEKTLDDVFGGGDASVSVILAKGEPESLVNGLKREHRSEISAALSSARCTAETADLEKALRLAESRLAIDPSLKIFLFTDTSFADMGTAFSVINVADAEKEWNAAILGCTVSIRDNEYVFEVRLGASGNVSVRSTLEVGILGADNGAGPEDFTLHIPVLFETDSDDPARETVQTVTVRATDPAYGGEDWFFDRYDEVRLELKELGDSVPDDDVCLVYGGMRDEVRVEYWSAEPNSFWQLGFQTLSNGLRDERRISFREVYADAGQTAESTGYDIYVFEHALPPELISSMPESGIVVLADPDGTAEQAGFGLKVGEQVTLPALTGCTAPAEHALFNYLDPAAIRLTQYRDIQADPPYLPILYCAGAPVAFVRQGEGPIVVVLAFSINRSDFYRGEFFTFLYNLLETYLPVTLSSSHFDVGESVLLHAKGDAVEMTGPAVQTFTEFPAQYRFSEPGTYTFTTRYWQREEVRKASVRISEEESRLFAVSDLFIPLDNAEETGDVGVDLFIWLAAAMLLLMLAEWYLQFRDIA